MALALLFSPKSMTAAQYDDVIRKLAAAGAGAPRGRLSHLAFGSGSGLRVLDVWESQEAFEAFGRTLMPILQQAGIDVGQPEIAPVHNTIAG